MKISDKYYLFKFNIIEKNIKLVTKSNSIKELKEQIIGLKSKSFDKYEFILIKLMKESKYNILKQDKSPLSNLIGGPIKLTIKMYKVSTNNILKPLYEKLLNKKGELDPDRRNSQFLYITEDYIKINNTIKTSHLKQVALYAGENKLEKRPLAAKLITQIRLN